MRPARHLSIVALAGAIFLAVSCERGGETPASVGQVPGATVPERPITAIGVPASDELPGLASAPTGIAFWTHPNVAFNSLLVVADETGLASYNMEDGNEVSRVPGGTLSGVALSYFGLATQAAGMAAAYDDEANAFRFYGIDNATRLFVPLDGELEIDAALRGFCLGRGDGVTEPTLFTLTKGGLGIVNLTLDDSASGIDVSDTTSVPIPDTITACAVDRDGVVILGGNDGSIYRLSGEQSFAAPFAQAGRAIADMEILASDSAAGQIAVIGAASHAIELFDREDGHALGAVTISATDEIDAVAAASTMGASAANLGGLYRDGALALGIAGEAPSIRIIPANGIANALNLTALAPANPRGERVEIDEPNTLIIKPILPQ